MCKIITTVTSQKVWVSCQRLPGFFENLLTILLIVTNMHCIIMWNVGDKIQPAKSIDLITIVDISAILLEIE